MKYQIYAGVDRERLVSLIPSRLKTRLPEWLPEDELYTLILVSSHERVRVLGGAKVKKPQHR